MYFEIVMIFDFHGLTTGVVACASKYSGRPTSSCFKENFSFAEKQTFLPISKSNYAITS